jgi:Protein of unknown function (DUF2628)
MAIYTIHLPPLEDRDERLQRLETIRDGFQRGAFVFGAFWLVWRRLWISAALLLLLIAALWGASTQYGLPLLLPLGGTFLLLLLLGLEGSSLRRWRLKRRGWQEAAVIAAGSPDEAARRFLEAALAAPAAAAAATPAPSPPRVTPADVIGLFPEPGARR